MEIGMERVGRKYSARSVQESHVKMQNTQKSRQSFDVLSIQSKTEDMENKIFEDRLIAELKEKLVKKPDDEKIERLRCMIQAGTYRPDASAIADRMLFLKGEEE